MGLGAFKTYFGLWFHQGALLKDEKSVLINAQEGKTKALRQWRMNSSQDINITLIHQYIRQAIAITDEGKEIKVDRHKPLVIPDVLNQALNHNPAAKKVFQSLRPGLQREYSDYVAEAKRDDTILRRVEKILPMIKQGIGLNDRYRK